jgi:hypothetical protein
MTNSAREQVIAVMPGKIQTERICLVLDMSHSEKPIILRSESFSKDLGWFVQGVVKMTRSDLSALRNVLGVPVSQSCSKVTNLGNQGPDDTTEPKILSFATARRA